MKNPPQNVSRWSLRRAIIVLLRGLVGAYGLYVILHVLATLIISDSWIPIAFLNTFAHLLWLPVLALIPLCLLAREWRLALMMVPGLLALVVIWGPMFWPQQSPAVDAESATIRIQTFNLYVWNDDLDAISDAIREIDADIVAMQELTPEHAAVLEDTFSDAYPHMAFHPIGSIYGQGIMSRLRIVDDRFWQHDFLDVGLGQQRVTVEAPDGRALIVYNVHPATPDSQGEFFNPSHRSREIAALLELATAETDPVVFLGDFNMPDLSSDYRAIRSAFDDAFREVGYGFGWTYPATSLSFSTFLRLDYIFYTPESLVPIRAEIWQEPTGSDHKTLYADVSIHRP